MLKELLIILVLTSSFPLGYLLAYLARDELISAKRYFKMLMALSFVLFLIFISLKDYIISCTLISIFIITYISLIKSKDKKWTKKRI